MIDVIDRLKMDSIGLCQAFTRLDRWGLKY